MTFEGIPAVEISFRMANNMATVIGGSTHPPQCALDYGTKYVYLKNRLISFVLKGQQLQRG